MTIRERPTRQEKRWGWPLFHLWACWDKIHPAMRTAALQVGWWHLWGEVSWWGGARSLLNKSTGINLGVWIGPLHLTLASKLTHGPEYKPPTNPEAT